MSKPKPMPTYWELAEEVTHLHGQLDKLQLGHGTCRLVRHGNLTDWPEMVCWSCSVCGFGWHHDVNDKQFSYCPNCGRAVMGA